MRNRKILFIPIFIILYFIIYSLNNIYKDREINLELQKEIYDLKKHYNITLYYNKRIADTFYHRLKNNYEVIDILKKINSKENNNKKLLRQKLQNKLENSYKSLVPSGLKIFMFVNEDNKTILRMHKPQKFGDDLSEVRYSFKYVNENKRIVRGFEQGKTSHAFRNIYPIFDRNGEFVASMGFSFSSDSMQSVLDQVNKIHSHFLVKKNVLDKREWQHAHFNTYYKESIEHKDYMISEVKEANHVKINISKKAIKDNRAFIDKNMNEANSFAIYKEDNDDLIVISFIPIESIKKDKKAAAYLVSYTKNEEIVHILIYHKIINIVSFLFLLAVLYVIYKQMVHKKELKEKVIEKTKDLKDLNESLEEKILIETEKNRQKDKQIYDNAKNAQMGEMIGNIAHQWRQPLSVISTISSGMKLKIELGIFEKDEAIKDLDSLNNTAQHLSKTIDIFRDYVKEHKELKEVVLQDRIDYTLEIVGSSLSNSYIEVIKDIDYNDPIKTKIIFGELSQVLINIINNAKDALLEKNIDDGFIKISLKRINKKALICIEDNAGGIKDDILPMIFDPYFTTKHQSQGTGIGLYMSRQIVEKHLNGKIYVKNDTYGAKFCIEIPIS